VVVCRSTDTQLGDLNMSDMLLDGGNLSIVGAAITQGLVLQCVNLSMWMLFLKKAHEAANCHSSSVPT
jgi:hypothetical protein